MLRIRKLTCASHDCEPTISCELHRHEAPWAKVGVADPDGSTPREHRDRMEGQHGVNEEVWQRHGKRLEGK